MITQGLLYTPQVGLKKINFSVSNSSIAISERFLLSLDRSVLKKYSLASGRRLPGKKINHKDIYQINQSSMGDNLSSLGDTFKVPGPVLTSGLVINKVNALCTISAQKVIGNFMEIMGIDQHNQIYAQTAIYRYAPKEDTYAHYLFRFIQPIKQIKNEFCPIIKIDTDCNTYNSYSPCLVRLEAMKPDGQAFSARGAVIDYLNGSRGFVTDSHGKATFIAYDLVSIMFPLGFSNYHNPEVLCRGSDSMGEYFADNQCDNVPGFE